MDFGIVDAHCHIFPPLGGACGFPDAATHLLFQQRSMHMHGNQPYRRARDHALVTARPLWDAKDPSEAGRRTDVAFRVGRTGRFEWTVDGEDQYVQFLPPHMTDLSAPAEVIVRDMDYAGIETAILQNDHIYGNLAEDFAAAAKAYPGRFRGLAQVEEAFAFRDDQLAMFADQIDRLGMVGLYFTTTGLFRDGYRRLPDHPDYAPLWREVERRGLTIAWVHSGDSPVGTYLDEMRHLAAIVEAHPGIRHVLVHGVPTGLYADEKDKVVLPDRLDRLMKDGAVNAEILYPIGWGGKMEYPYPRAVAHARQLIETYGVDRFLWGSDMPNVARYCTFRQSLTYIADHAPFLSDADRRKLFRDNALALYGGEGGLSGGPILSVAGLTVRIDTAERGFAAIRDVSFDVRPGETYAIVGESGSGKSLTALAVMGLLPENAARRVAGVIRLGDEDLAGADEHRLEQIRGNRISMVFQEPMTSLNPSMRVGQQVAEALELHRGMKRAEAMREVVALFEKVRIADPERRLSEYPHRLSGGMRQRVMIALALACRPELIIADEPTTALDVTTQAQILKLFRDLQAEIGMATILITHDLAVVAETAERVAVMYAGRIVEEATSEALFAAPRHPYTLGLMRSMPRIVGRRPGEKRGRLAEIAGAVPPLWKLPDGCAYAPRCPFASDRCHADRPPLVASEPGRRLACFNPVAVEIAA